MLNGDLVDVYKYLKGIYSEVDNNYTFQAIEKFIGTESFRTPVMHVVKCDRNHFLQLPSVFT